ncbi:cytochrome c oxidase subunit 4 [Kitasatospora sp. GAS204B]|uniref:aa3-type cytochrome oxidase subunit IV n=1 Tax=unclassified Kitasatospora TaxID=2633591 RepID=UPI002473A05B|nr:cytochrome c oxidase subunit 4 [Kitasatospora sp. GAS204B]MDH6121604.1 disulfide bond formation protein DsbB [Kitasatospora sp. GAS204B]
MRFEAYLFAGIALFFGVIGGIYDWLAHEPAGKGTLAFAFLMSALIAVFFFVQSVRHGPRAQDRREVEVAETSGPLDFFPPQSWYPPLLAAGAGVSALGLVFGVWLLLIGAGITAAGVGGFVFQYVNRGG